MLSSKAIISAVCHLSLWHAAAIKTVEHGETAVATGPLESSSDKFLDTAKTNPETAISNGEQPVTTVTGVTKNPPSTKDPMATQEAEETTLTAKINKFYKDHGEVLTKIWGVLSWIFVAFVIFVAVMFIGWVIYNVFMFWWAMPGKDRLHGQQLEEFKRYQMVFGLVLLCCFLIGTAEPIGFIFLLMLFFSDHFDHDN